ncbi:unnamed protein product [Trichobilharzia regenti]|nr:unnamed protein product [Trichobilharzia regenti]
MLSVRGVSDDGTTSSRNNSLHRHHTMLTDTNMNRPYSSGKLQRALSDQPSEKSDPYGVGQLNEPTETQLLLPTRSNNGTIGNHPTRSRRVGAGASTKGSDTNFSGLGRIWKKSNVNEKTNSDNMSPSKRPNAPLASREDSWLSDIPKSSGHPESFTSSEATTTGNNTTDMSGISPSNNPSRNVFNFGRQNLEGIQFNSHKNDNISRNFGTNNDAEYLLDPPPPPPTQQLGITDDYLQPKTNAASKISNTCDGGLTKQMNYTELGPPTFHDTPTTDEYLNPNMQQPEEYLSPILSGFGVTNPEYLMYPNSRQQECDQENISKQIRNTTSDSTYSSKNQNKTNQE